MRTYLILSFIVGLFITGFSLYQAVMFYDGKLHIIFCSVGQGDAIFIRTPQGSSILVDGGPNEAVLDCLSRHMPFWQRRIDLVLLSHPHADHLNGLIGVVNHYTVGGFATEKLNNTTAGYIELMKLVEQNHIMTQFVYKGDELILSDRVILRVLGPTKDFLTRTSPSGIVGESREFGSVIPLISYGSFQALLTGDTQSGELSDAIVGLSDRIEVLQVPHHGSKTGLTSQILDRINPQVTVISVGRNNYGHPSPQTLKILREKGTRILRTDKDGDVEIISDGMHTAELRRTKNAELR